jgi:prepilin-type N-terminal cleavage/methylation domain-containing protein
MEKTKIKTKGLTLVEIILVVVIAAILLGMSLLYYQTSQLNADINTRVREFVSYLRLAQSDTMAGLNDKSHGIHLETSSYTIFEGSGYNPADPQNSLIELPEIITIQNININGDGNDIIFLGPDGTTDDYGTLDFNSSQLSKTVTITISALGTVNY